MTVAQRDEKPEEGDGIDKELDDILAQALKEPGVAEAMEFYERVEKVYGSALTASQPVEQTTNSANV